jgi:hypothetical protein
VADKDVEHTDEIIRSIALKVAEDLLADTSDMCQHILLEVIEALERGEDVYDELLSKTFTRPFMERFINELIKYENERD